MGSFSHILAGFTLGLQYRRQLRELLDSTSTGADILHLEPESLKSSGITTLAVDFDGVLAGHGFSEPLPAAVAWLKRCEAVFGGDQLFILSNKPTEVRRLWFAEHFPAIRFIAGVRKKPYPDGLNRTGELAGVPLSSVLMIDDRLLTGCLAALAAGAQPCYIRRPYISFNHRPLAELFFFSVRKLERLFVRVVSFF